MSDPNDGDTEDDLGLDLDEDTSEQAAPAARSSWFGRWGRGLLKGLGIAVAVLVAMTAVGFLRGPSLPETAPDFDLPDIDGERVVLSDLRGTPVLLNFWATWCGPCRIEAPALSRFADRHDELVVLGIAADGNARSLRKSGEELGITYRIVRGDRKVFVDYGVQSFPTTVLLDADGQVVTSYTGMMLDPQLELAVLGL